MDNNNNSTMITLIIINLIINFITVIDHFITKLKRSKCWGSEIEMKNDNKDDTLKNHTQDNDKLKELIDILNNKSNNNKSNNDIKKDDSVNKL